MLEGKEVIGETDMLQSMQQDVLRLTGQALDEFDVTESTDIASFIKKSLTGCMNRDGSVSLGEILAHLLHTTLAVSSTST